MPTQQPFMDKQSRNALFRAVEAGGLNPAECALDSATSHTTINHQQTNSYIRFYHERRASMCASVVGDLPERKGQFSGKLEDAQEYVRLWSATVLDYGAVPDLWAEAYRNRDFLRQANYAAPENSPFTSEEQ
jgi:hypothetical protein